MSHASSAPARSAFFYPVELDNDFPVRGGTPGLQLDDPISALHWHDSLEIGLCTEGAGIFVVGEKVIPFAAGDVTVIGPTEVHIAQSLPGTASRWYWIYLDPVRLLARSGESGSTTIDLASFTGPRFDNVIKPGEDAAIGEIVSLIVDELRDPRYGQRPSVVSLVAHLLIRVQRLRGVTTPSRVVHDPVGFDRIAPAISIIAREFSGELSVSELAKACRVSEPTLRRLFLAAVGQTPREYWLGLRLRMAASMLRGTSLTVIEVSRTVGFTTLSSFNRLFHRNYGATPSAWRRAAEGSETVSDRKQSDVA